MATQNRRISRLFIDRDLSRGSVGLSERETNYLGNVLRLKRGDRVLAFDGRGHERHASIASLARKGGELELLDDVTPLPESELELTLIQALPKTEAMDFVVQKITELGVHSLWPVTTDFSVVRLDAGRAAKRVEHWKRVSQSACEQSGRHRPPEVLAPMPLDAALAEIPPRATRLVLDTQAAERLDPAAHSTGPVFVAVGPEGGFSPADLDSVAGAGFTRIRLGPRTLRAETAAVAVCALLQALWGDLR
ncbi:MAG: 16S rRNA (uracil(1498)-N(3))-methyltransferase [Gammaproteobacteria bacterium]|nr:16S rRNA (uracil(1498)-N(3))-methyltransferase [Gammaproteobacteria bacterium]